MFCKKNKKNINLGKGVYKTCNRSKTICGGWKFVYTGCLPSESRCRSSSGAWLPVTTVCKQNLFRVFVPSEQTVISVPVVVNLMTEDERFLKSEENKKIILEQTVTVQYVEPSVESMEPSVESTNQSGSVSKFINSVKKWLK